MISQSFENSFERIVRSSDVTIRKIKQTYAQKREFWEEVIDMYS